MNKKTRATRVGVSAGFTMIEAMVGLAISATVMAGVVVVVSQMATLDSNNRLQSLVNQTYLNAVQITENPYLFGERRAVNQNPLNITPELRACLAGQGATCKVSFDGKPNADVPAVVDPNLQRSFNFDGVCTEGATNCLVKRTVKYAWVCSSATLCSGVRFDIVVQPLDAGRLKTDTRVKARSGSVTLPSRQFTPKGEIRFTCAAGGVQSLFAIDYVNMTDAGGCGRFDGRPDCRMPMRIYAAGSNNCQPQQTADCAAQGFSTVGLYAAQNTCVTAQQWQASCPNGGQLQPNGRCWYANRWCKIASADPNSATLGFGPNNTGAQHEAGCGADRWYQTGEVTTAIGFTAKCMTAPYADFPVPDSYCPVTVQPCPTGQTRQPNGTCTPNGGYRWANRDKNQRVFKYGQFVVYVNGAGRLCGATRPYNPDSVMTVVPGGATDCPPLGPYFWVYENVSAVSCSVPGSTCQQKVYGFNFSLRDTGTTIVNNQSVGYLDDRVEDCSDVICVDTTACPDGSPRSADQSCPSHYGRWVAIDDGVNSGPPCPEVNRAVGNGAGGFCRPLYSRCSGYNGSNATSTWGTAGGICNPTDLPLPTCLPDEVRRADGNCTGIATASVGRWHLIDQLYRPGNIMNGGGPPVSQKARTYGYDCPPLPDEPEGKGCPVPGASCYITQFDNQWFRYRCQ